MKLLRWLIKNVLFWSKIMNSSQRRKRNREFKRDNAKEIERVITWIKGTDKFVPSEPVQIERKCIQLFPERLVAFDINTPGSKIEWREYLEKRGVLVD